jgi:hypothetical protein
VQFRNVVRSLAPTDREALAKCCCHKAFLVGYQDCADPDPVCKAAVDAEVRTVWYVRCSVVVCAAQCGGVRCRR